MKLNIPGGWPSPSSNETSSAEASVMPTPPPTAKGNKRHGLSEMFTKSRPVNKFRVRSKASRVLRAMKRPTNFLRGKSVLAGPFAAKSGTAGSATARPGAAESGLARSIATRLTIDRPQFQPILPQGKAKPVLPQGKPIDFAGPVARPVPQQRSIPATAPAPRPRFTAAGYIDATIELPPLQLKEIEDVLIAYRAPLEPTDLIPNTYAAVRKLGSSGEGSVELAKPIDGATGPLIALKEFHDKTRGLHFAHMPNEVKTMFGKLGSHPNVIKAFQAELYPGNTAILSLEYCAGGDLNNTLKRFVDLKVATPVIFTYHLYIQLAEALAFIHNGLSFGKNDYNQNTALESIIHGDLKPDNILLRPGNNEFGMPDFVLADFGLAAPASDPRFVGTPGWMAPEVQAGFEGLPGPPMTVRSDTYSYAMVIYGAMTQKHWETGAKPETLRVPAVYETVGLDKELKRCLAKNPSDRPLMTDASNGTLPFVIRLRKHREALFKKDGPLDDKLFGKKEGE